MPFQPSLPTHRAALQPDVAPPRNDDLRRCGSSARVNISREIALLDLLYLVGGTAFFAIAVLYAAACDHL